MNAQQKEPAQNELAQKELAQKESSQTVGAASSERDAARTVLDITQIMSVLPHRYPFLLVDRIIDYEPGKWVVGIKNVTLNEPFFEGHFPGAPVMPGVLIVEAMAQTAGVLMLASLPDRESKLVFFTGIDGAKFRRPVVPGDQLRLELTVLKLRPRYIKLRGEAYVERQLVAEAQISSSLVDRSLVERGDQINRAAFTPVEK